MCLGSLLGGAFVHLSLRIRRFFKEVASIQQVLDLRRCRRTVFLMLHPFATQS